MQQRTVDNYRIEEELGQGGMAVVYRAHDTRLGREVALKVLHEHIASRAENRERFEREARAVARLEHPNIIRVYGFSSPSAPVQYIAAELVDGPTLREQVERRPFGLPEVGAMACLAIARALGHAHEIGIVHRDLKPENIMFSSAGIPKLMDFGLARLLDAQKLTQTGAIMGSPAHMSPELIEGLPVDARADVFAFGTVLYFALCHRLPFDGRNPAVILNAILGGEYAEPERINPLISPALASIIARCLETDPEARYADGDEVAEALAAALSEMGIDEPDAEFVRWSADPDGYEAELRARLVGRWLERGRQARERGQLARALACADRVLALQPDSDAANALLVSTQRARRRIGVLVAALVTIVVVSLMAVIAGPVRRALVAPNVPATVATVDAPNPGRDAGSVDGAAPDGGEDIRQPMTLVPVTTPGRAPTSLIGSAQLLQPLFESVTRNQASAEGAAVAAATRGVAESAAPHRDTPRRPDAGSRADTSVDAGVADAAALVDAAPVVEPVLVSFNIYPLGAYVQLDGEPVGQADALRNGLLLAPGPHVVEAMHEGRLDSRTRVEFVAGPGMPNSVQFRVPWPPALLLVQSDVEADVFMDGRQLGVANEDIEFDVTGADRTISRTISVISRDGGDPQISTVVLTAGERFQIQARF